jgi:hypothetical protein
MAEEEELPIFQAVATGDADEVARLLDAEPHLLEARDEGRCNATPLRWPLMRGMWAWSGCCWNGAQRSTLPGYMAILPCIMLLGEVMRRWSMSF